MYVAPANLESFGLAALEARCAGLPVVAKAQTGIREFVEHGQEGLLAANDHQFVDQVLALVRDPALRAKIAGLQPRHAGAVRVARGRAADAGRLRPGRRARRPGRSRTARPSGSREPGS